MWSAARLSRGQGPTSANLVQGCSQRDCPTGDQAQAYQPAPLRRQRGTGRYRRGAGGQASLPDHSIRFVRATTPIDEGPLQEDAPVHNG